MASNTSPKISVALSFMSLTYHFSDLTAPKLSLTVRFESENLIVLFTWHTVLWPKLALAQRHSFIMGLTDNVEVTQTSTWLQRMLFTRIRGVPDEKYYLNIMPGTPTIVFTRFGRDKAHPQPKAVAERGWELDENGNEMRLGRKSTLKVSMV